MSEVLGRAYLVGDQEFLDRVIRENESLKAALDPDQEARWRQMNLRRNTIRDELSQLKARVQALIDELDTW